jgi:hypothetical protein
MKDFMPSDWELVSGDRAMFYTVHRLLVPNGWIYWTRTWHSVVGGESSEYLVETSNTLFVPGYAVSAIRGLLLKKSKYLIWWVTPLSSELTLAMGMVDALVPQYIKNEFYKMNDQADVIGNVYVPEELKADVKIDFPEDHPALDMLAEKMTGIVIKAEDLWSVITWPGFLTDFNLQAISVSLTDVAKDKS